MNQLTALLAPQSQPATYDSADLDHALTAARTHLGMPSAFLVAVEGDDLMTVAVSNRHVDSPYRAGMRYPARGSIAQMVLDDNLPQLIPDMSRAAVVQRQATKIGAMISVPIPLHSGGLYGLFCCVSPEPMATLNARDLEVMMMFAGMVTDAINSRISEEASTVQAIDGLHDVIVDQDFQIMLQPIVQLATGKIEGAEALCRFRPTPYRSPDKWFDEAEKVGLRLELELATVRKSLSMLPHMPANQYLSINASANMACAPELLALLDGPRADRIVLELTDHQNIPDLEILLKSLKQIRALGVRIAVDDFAPTHDAFATMMRIKPDILKMDRSLVRGVHLDIPNQALIMSLVHFAAAINATLLGEGIEITAEHKCLQTLGIRSGQGFLIGTPELMSAHQELLGQVSTLARLS